MALEKVHKGYKVLQHNNHQQLTVELNQLGMDGWKPILISTVQAGGAGVIITVIVEHENG
jgi:hypothetical protein